MNICIHEHIFVIKCQQKKTSFPKIFDQRYGLNIHKFPTPNVDKEYSRICLSNNNFFYCFIFLYLLVTVLINYLLTNLFTSIISDCDKMTLSQNICNGLSSHNQSTLYPFSSILGLFSPHVLSLIFEFPAVFRLNLELL